MKVRIMVKPEPYPIEEEYMECPLEVDNVFVKGGDPMMCIARIDGWMDIKHQLPDRLCELQIWIFSCDADIEFKFDDNGDVDLYVVNAP